MSVTPDITATILFHREGEFAVAALASLRDLARTAASIGLTVETRAVLDQADDLTRHLVAARGDFLSGVEEISVGDPGIARNAGAASAHGEFLAFLDGDDLWGADWLSLAHKAATATGVRRDTIWHPEVVYYFYDCDVDDHSDHATPHSRARSFYMMHGGSDAAGFDRNALFLNNLWTANAFTTREIHSRYPYLAIERDRGLGVEDWTWNIATLFAGIPHLVIPDTVHLIRVKTSDSMGFRNGVEGLLPHLPAGAFPKFGGERAQ